MYIRGGPKSMSESVSIKIQEPAVDRGELPGEKWVSNFDDANPLLAQLAVHDCFRIGEKALDARGKYPVSDKSVFTTLNAEKAWAEIRRMKQSLLD